jgi:hypothetical protein
MTSVDENKLLAMREYILKLANATSRYFFSSSAPESPKVQKSTALRHASIMNLTQERV